MAQFWHPTRCSGAATSVELQFDGGVLILTRNREAVSRLSVLPERQHGGPLWAAAAG